MQAQDIAQLGAWLAATDIDLLELRGPQGQVRIQRELEAAYTSHEQPGSAAPVVTIDTPSAVRSVKASVPGVWRNQLPGRTEPLVLVGATVHANDLLGLLQVGPLLLPVRAPSDGILGAWCVEPGTAVGYGSALAALHPLSNARLA